MINSDINKAYWDELATIHSELKGYGMEDLLAGQSTLREIEADYFGNLNGKKVLHLQCHFGLDSISINKYHNGEVVGVDFSANAVEKGQELNDALQGTTRFICCNVYDLKNHLDEKFDIVYTSYGVIMWLNDLEEWANIINHFLKPEGEFLLVEEHPFAAMLKSNEKGELTPGYPYNTKKHYETNNSTSYADRQTKLVNTKQYKWGHGFQEILGALLSKGFELSELKEYPHCFYQMFANMTFQDGWWKLEPNEFELPLMFSLRLRKK